jgi:hypothetical protein
MPFVWEDLCRMRGHALSKALQGTRVRPKYAGGFGSLRTPSICTHVAWAWDPKRETSRLGTHLAHEYHGRPAREGRARMALRLGSGFPTHDSALGGPSQNAKSAFWRPLMGGTPMLRKPQRPPPCAGRTRALNRAVCSLTPLFRLGIMPAVQRWLNGIWQTRNI